MIRDGEAIKVNKSSTITQHDLQSNVTSDQRSDLITVSTMTLSIIIIIINRNTPDLPGRCWGVTVPTR